MVADLVTWAVCVLLISRACVPFYTSTPSASLALSCRVSLATYKGGMKAGRSEVLMQGALEGWNAGPEDRPYGRVAFVRVSWCSTDTRPQVPWCRGQA